MRLTFLFLLLLGTTVWAGKASPAQQAPTEYQVKAAYLFNFLKFIEWPADSFKDPQGRWVIGVVGNSPIVDDLSQLVSAKSVLGRQLQIKTFESTEDLRGCNMVFISGSESKHLASILAGLRGSSVLTVADMDNFIQSGGMIQLVLQDGSVRLAIDAGATSRAHLKVSSKLFSLALAVTGAPGVPNN